MSYKIGTNIKFRKEAKRLITKDPSIKKEIDDLGEKLSQNPTLGTGIGNHCYKIRMAIGSKGKGKSGGARVITCVYVSVSTVFLLSIYDKSERENITDKELKKLINEISD